jgi:hypothetical protein
MVKQNDITNQTFNKLTAIEKRPGTKWLFRCECGTKKEIDRDKVVKSITKSCGCLRKSQFKTHGQARTRFYRIYTAAKARCENPSFSSYENYGARGIEFRFSSFQDFYKDLYDSYQRHVAEHGEGNTSIDRINNDGHYEASNCKWSTRKEQNNNRRLRRYFRKPM